MWEATNPALSIVRLHGRNHAPWNQKGLTNSSQRFNYDYSDDELTDIAGDVKALARRVEVTHVLFNNNFQDQGQRGARTLTKLLAADGR